MFRNFTLEPTPKTSTEGSEFSSTSSFPLSFIFTTLTLIEGLIVSSLISASFLLCRIIFYAPHSLRLLMLDRDGEWQLPVIYNRSTSAVTKQHQIDTNAHPGNFHSGDSSLHTLCHFLYFCLLSQIVFLVRPSHRVSIKTKNLSNQNVFSERQVDEEEEQSGGEMWNKNNFMSSYYCRWDETWKKAVLGRSKERREQKKRKDNKNLKFNSPIL